MIQRPPLYKLVTAVAVLCAAAGAASAQTPSERCAAAQRVLEAQRAADMAWLKLDTSGRLGLVRMEWMPDASADADTTDAISTELQHPMFWSVPVAYICVRRTTGFTVDLFREDGTAIGVYEFENVEKGQYVFDVRHAIDGVSISGLLQVRMGDRVIGKAQEVYFGGR